MKPIVLALTFVVPLIIAARALAEDTHGHHHDPSAEAHTEDAEKGIHGGRLLTKDDFALEITIFEQDVPPQFRVYAYHRGALVKPEKVAVTIELKRFGEKRDQFTLLPESDFLTSPQIVEEPHSFAVAVTAKFAGKTFEWTYESFEGRTELSEEGLKVAKITIATVAPQKIKTTVRVYGRLLPNEDKVAHVVPRFPGVISEIRKSLGDKVKKGEVLAVIEANQSLRPYEIRSQVDGVVIKRHATLGEFVSDNKELFVVADLSEIWADFHVYRNDFGTINPGQTISVHLGGDSETEGGGAGSQISAVVTYTSPVIDEVTQSKLIRATLPNPDGLLRPGLFVSGSLSSSDAAVPVAVHREALQTFRDWTVVFLTDGHVFQAQPVTLGKKDAKYVEVLSGLSVGDRYVSHQSFIIKADIEKSGASHDH